MQMLTKKINCGDDEIPFGLKHLYVRDRIEFMEKSEDEPKILNLGVCRLEWLPRNIAPI